MIDAAAAAILGGRSIDGVLLPGKHSCRVLAWGVAAALGRMVVAGTQFIVFIITATGDVHDRLVREACRFFSAQ